MKRNFSALSTLPALLLAALLTAVPAAARAQPPADTTEVSTEIATPKQPEAGDTADAGAHPVRDSSIGCATGAVLGSVLPGLGNAVGCVVGGVLGWWFS